ncbi:MAG TPA: tyrosine-type recombinase/integrase, partial [Chitinophagaceae bacterium]|nr:tyrosine-type recombinase/integrase [Chitinophagaceae bacterium]
FTYNDLLSFMRNANGQRITKRTLHNILCVIRHYCNYLIHEGKRTDNPAAGVFIKGLVRKLPTGLISFDELEELYKQYSIQISVDRSKKIMLGLMIYQGVTVGELERIERKDIKLKEGKIKIRGTGRTNERILDLFAGQVIDLQQYLSENRYEEKLFTGPWISNRVQYMFDQLKQLNAKVINAKQIRSSVITHWLRKNNLRQVQYMAGHKFVSSTQRYQLNHLDDLKNELQQHHPMS